ncbi:MAG: glycosyltransferase family 39 protein [Prolixibacteraceae bacterium]|nr:glycosyltransferase family 39 protein [Prolixibacteraceae bacterium]
MTHRSNITVNVIFWLLAVLILISYFSGLPVDVTRDAGKYATVSREIYENGNYINLTVHGEPYDQKPPLLFWLGALGFKLGGVSNFWFKLPVLLLVFFGFYSAYKLGESLYNRRVGLITAFMLVFSLIYKLYSMDIHTDTPLQALVTFALWQLHEFIKYRKNINWFSGFAATGLAMLTKGPIGAAIPAFAVTGHLLLSREFKFFTDYRWYLGIIIAFIFASPALIGLWNQFGTEGITFFFWDNNIGRLAGTYVKSTNDPVFYFHSLLYLFLPWSIMLFIISYYDLRTLIRNRFKAAEYFTVTGIWIYFIIINISKNQLPNYIFIIMPLFAVLTAKWTDIAIRERGKLYKLLCSAQKIMVVLIFTAITVIAVYLFPIPSWLWWIVAVSGLAAVFLIYRKTDDPLIRLLVPPAIGFVCLSLLLNTHVFPFMFSHQAPPKAARYFNENSREGDMLYNFNYLQYELFFYSKPEAVQLHNPEEAKAVAGKDGSWIFTDAEGFTILNESGIAADTIIKYQHLYLNRGGQFINPKTRDKVLRPMYLIKY